jgi:DNA-binding NtrC family response regulator
VVSATHRDLDALVAEGRFRQDLYFRLRIVPIVVPPLRERREDLPLLAARFLHLAVARYDTGARRLSPEALAALESSPWPGNVRELRHVLEQAAVLSDGDTIDASLLPLTLLPAGPTTEAAPGTWRAAQERALDAAAREYFVALLRRLGGNVTRAASEAGIERETLHRLLRKHGVDAGKFRG